MNSKPTETEIDELVIAQADDDAWDEEFEKILNKVPAVQPDDWDKFD